MEEALRVSEREKAIILDNMSEQLIYQDKEMRVLWTNKAACEPVGKAPEELVGHHCYEIWHKRSKPCKGCPVKRTGETGEPQESEIAASDGRILFVRSNPVKDENGKFVGVVEVTEDITKRKKAEDELEEYKRAVESSEDMITAVDSRYVNLFVNEAFLGYHGLSRDQVVGRTVAEVLGKDVFENKIKPGLDHCLQGKLILYDIEYHFSEIGDRNLEVSCFPRKGVDEKVTGVFSVARDTTELRRAEDALRKSEARFRNFLDNLGDIAYQTDADGNVTYANKMGEKLSGVSLENALGKPFLPYVSKESRKEAIDMFQGILKGERPEFEVMLTSGKICHFKNELLRDKKGNVIGVFGTGRDITERKRAEEELRESEEKYRDLVENINDVLVVIDIKGVITYISPVIEALSGYFTSEIIGQPFKKFVCQEDLPQVTESFIKVLSGIVEPIELRVVTRFGDLLWVYISGRPIYKNNRIVGFQGMMTDITERKQAEEALRESEERFRSIFENIRDMYYRADLEGKLTMTNPLGIKIMGYDSPEEVIGKDIAEGFYYRPEDRKAVMEELEKHGEITNREIIIKRKDGTPVILEVSSHVVCDETSKPIAIEGLARDITERKQAELELQKARDELETRVIERTAALRKSEQQLQERLRELICLFEIRQEFDRNEPLEKTLVRCTEHIRQSLNDPERKGVVIVLDERLLVFDDKYMPSDNCLEVPLVITGRQRGCLRVYCYAIDSPRQPFEQDLVKEAGATLSSFIQNRELQRQLVQTEKLAATGRVAAGVAHEINNPLGAIKNSLYILKEAIEADHEYYCYVELMDSEIERMAGIIVQLYELYKPVSRKTQPVKLHSVVDNVMKMMNPKIHRRKVQVCDNMDRSIPKLNTSVHQLTQVLYNIIENSLQAMSDGGTLTITSKKSADEVELAIRDTGPGIPDDVVPHIFEPFFTTRGMSKVPGEGMGMGLSLSRSIMETLGGGISVRTIPGKGTTFILHFPTK